MILRVRVLFVFIRFELLNSRFKYDWVQWVFTNSFFVLSSENSFISFSISFASMIGGFECFACNLLSFSFAFVLVLFLLSCCYWMVRCLFYWLAGNYRSDQMFFFSFLSLSRSNEALFFSRILCAHRWYVYNRRVYV